MTRGATQRLVDAMTGPHLSEGDVAQLTRRIEIPIQQRLRPMLATAAEAKQDAFIKNLARCDDLQNPVVRALKLVYEDGTLGVVTKIDPTKPHKRPKTLGREQTMLLYTQPPNLELLVPIPGITNPEHVRDTFFFLQ
jgi:hypothetical protein